MNPLFNFILKLCSSLNCVFFTLTVGTVNYILQVLIIYFYGL